MASDGKWRVTASRYVHKDRWITVRADDCVKVQVVESLDVDEKGNARHSP